jgi:adenine phosphoribosyltransferase
MGGQENIKSGGEKNNMVVEEAPPTAAKKENGSIVATDPRLQGISDAIRVVPHFPKPGPPAQPASTQL